MIDELGIEQQEVVCAGPRVLAADFLWRPSKVKILWFCSFTYWAGVLVSQAKPEMLPFYQTLLGGYLTMFLFPPIVLMVLGAFLLRAKLDAGEWIIVPISRPHGPMYGEPGGPGDPLTDPYSLHSNWPPRHDSCLHKGHH